MRIIYLLIFCFFALQANAKVTENCRNAKIVAYTKDQCIYCKKFKTLLDEEQIEFQNKEVTGNKILLNWLISSTNNYTVPFIFMDDKYIGGFTDFLKLCYKGK